MVRLASWKEAKMKSLMTTVGIALCALPISAANAGIMTLGDSFARSCYEASEARDTRRSAIEDCDHAFSDQALDLNDEVATHVNRGIIFYLRDNLAAANQDYDMALALNPNEPEAWLNKGMAALKMGDSRSAGPMFERALELKTKRPALAYYGRAIVNEDTNNVRDAYADLQRARALEPYWMLPAEELKRYVIR